MEGVKRTRKEYETIKSHCTEFMKTRRDCPATIPNVAAVILLPIFCLLLTSGCAGHKQYRTTLSVCADTNAPDFPKAALERTPKYLLGFVEFDDQGWLWSRPQMDAVLKEIKQEMGPNHEKGVLLFTFVHGWKNNAAYDNENVQEVRETLNYLADVEIKQAKANGVTPRKLVGVYVGWRGLTQKLWAVKQTTFWGRKRTGHEVGRGALTELLMRLEAMVNESKAAAKAAGDRVPGERPAMSRLLIVGHSFGAGATYSAVAPLYLERMLVPHHVNEGAATTRGFGDLVVLVNPAFEAARFQVLRDAASSLRTDGTRQDQLLNLAIFTSKGDTATKNLFPIGRFFSTLFQSHQTNGQHRANKTAVGHYRKFVTHDLVPQAKGAWKRDQKSKDQQAQQANYDEKIRTAQEAVQARRKQFRDATDLREVFQVEQIYGSTRLKPRRDAEPSPFIVAQVDTDLVPNHNNISREQFTTFLRLFMLSFAAEDERR